MRTWNVPMPNLHSIHALGKRIRVHKDLGS